MKIYSRRLQSPLSILYADTILRCWFSWSDAFYCCCWCWSFGRSDGRLLYKCAFMQNRKICVLCSLSSHRVRRDGWPKRYGWLKAASTINSMQEPHWILTNVQQLFKLDSRVQKWVSTLHTKYSVHDGSANGSTNNNKKRHYIHLLLCFPRIVCTIRRDFLILRRALTPINKTTWGWFFFLLLSLSSNATLFWAFNCQWTVAHSWIIDPKTDILCLSLFAPSNCHLNILHWNDLRMCAKQRARQRWGERAHARKW